MTIISKISIKNYKCYRERQDFDLDDATFLVGGNNAGKSVILKAIRCFFSNEEMFLEDFNQTEIKSKKAASNVLEIELCFDVMSLKSTAKDVKRAKVLAKKSHGFLTVLKRANYRDSSDTVDFEYLLNQGDEGYIAINQDVQNFLARFSVSYLHPQEADRLLSEAQEKLKKRLLSKFGRGAARFEALEGLEKSWQEMREEANRDLSANLTDELKKVWPEAAVTVELPKSIDEIVAISEIRFKGAESLPELSLSEQGNGVQSAVLYQAHYLLDSDKTIHRGLYFPIWLVEEPESFLHADITYKIGRLLVSAEWLGVVQMLVTTHSPLILAASASASSEKNIRWSLLDQSCLLFSKKTSDLAGEHFSQVGSCLGDANFEIYFNASSNEDVIIIEDSRPLTTEILIKSGIPVGKSLNGSGELKKYVDTLNFMDLDISSKFVFLLDNDKGSREFRSILTEQARHFEQENFVAYKIKSYLWILLFPPGMAVEDLFDEYDDFLVRCVEDLYDVNDAMNEWVATTSKMVSPNLSRTHAEIRGKQKAMSIELAKEQIAKSQDVKNLFWADVQSRGYAVSNENVAVIKHILDQIGFGV